MLIVAGTITFDPAHQEDIVAAAHRVTGPTREEEGCLSYEIFADLSGPGRLHVFEQWEEEHHWAAHLETPHFTEYAAFLQSCGLRTRDFSRYYVSKVVPNRPA